MTEQANKNDASNKNLLLQYAGIGAQIIAGLLLFVFVGRWIDGKLRLSFPLLIWLLPLIFLIALLLKVVRDTSNKKNE